MHEKSAQSTSITAHHPLNFLLKAPKSFFKTLFIDTRLGENLSAMWMSVPKGLKRMECKHCIGGKNSLFCYIPEQDSLQDALMRDKQIPIFKLTYPTPEMNLKW